MNLTYVFLFLCFVVFPWYIYFCCAFHYQPTLQGPNHSPNIPTKPGKPMVPKLALNSIPSRNNENSMSSPSSPRRQSRAFSFGLFLLGGVGAVLKTVENGNMCLEVMDVYGL